MDVSTSIVAWGTWALRHKAKFHYAQVRPMPLTAKLPITTDCSGFFTLCYFLADAPDPNGLRYSHYGYTGTLLNHGRHIGPNMVRPGDAVVYGGGTGEHVALICEVTRNGILSISMGQEGDPSYVWVRPPKANPQRFPIDNRQPQTFLRFNTKKVHPIKKAINKVITTVHPKKAPPQGYQRPGSGPAGGVVA